jgi:hypothetical protein
VFRGNHNIRIRNTNACNIQEDIVDASPIKPKIESPNADCVPMDIPSQINRTTINRIEKKTFGYIVGVLSPKPPKFLVPLKTTTYIHSVAMQKSLL